MKKSEFALETFKNIQELIRFIDQKSGAVLVLAGLILTAYLEIVKNLNFVSFEKMSFLNFIVFFLSLSTLISISMVIYISIFKILKPRLAKNYDKNEYSLFYFEHLKALGKENINNEYINITEEQMTKYLIDQQYEVSIILDEKTSELAKSFNWLFISFIISIIFMFCTNIL